MLQGIGPENSAMGGAGTALLEDSLGALTFNPALIAGVQGNQLSFGTEFFKDSPQVDTTIVLPPGFKGNGTATRELTIYPAFGWMSRPPDKKLALGFGLIGIGGFRTDYPGNPYSILFGPPQGAPWYLKLVGSPLGFGRAFSDYRVTRIPIAAAYQLTPKLSIGAAFSVYYAEYAQGPLTSGPFDASPTGARYYPPAGNMSGAFGLGGQIGFVYQLKPSVTVGASFTTPQHYQTFTWNSTFVDPTAQNYGRSRTLTAKLNGPMIVSFGAGLKVGKKTRVAIDGMFTKYEGVEGFGSPGGFVNGVVNPFGWRNVWTAKAGLHHQASEKLALRLGYNYTQSPLRSEVILTGGIASPFTYEHHFCGGFGYKMLPFLTAEASGSYAPRKHATGPFPTVLNFELGTVDFSNQAASGLIGLNFTF
jgi:long-chain fatty acid transport protein